MAKRKILTDNDPTLRMICRPVEKITPRIITLLDDMLETMREADGVGLAGPQVGVLRRVVVVETEPGNPIELINPVIVDQSGEQEGGEGCLSLPGRSGCVRRPMHVTVKALNREGKEFTVEGSELTARAFCHEIDHLDGILYTDKALYMNDPEDEIEEQPEERRSVRRHKFSGKH
ncbi:MAG: peptide deformylase [Clostridia bacterium]|nr:peptide deformylase [Clostridia bacterium]